MIYRILADVVAVVHLGYVLCVVVGLAVILVGRALGWEWVRNRWFRGAHMAMIAVVVLRALVWEHCPLTWWERDLRELGGQVVKVDGEARVNYQGHRLGEFCHNAIHPEDVPEWNFDPPAWIYLVVYSLFGTLVIGTFWVAPVRWRKQVALWAAPPPPLHLEVVLPEADRGNVARAEKTPASASVGQVEEEAARRS